MGRFMSMLGMLFGFGTFGRGFVGTLVGGGDPGGAPQVPPLGRVWAEALDESRKAANINPSECEAKRRDMEPPTHQRDGERLHLTPVWVVPTSFEWLVLTCQPPNAWCYD